MKGLKVALATLVMVTAFGVFTSTAAADRPASVTCAVTGFNGTELTFVCTSSNGDTLTCTASLASYTLTCTSVVSGTTYTCTLARKSLSCTPALPTDSRS